MATDNYRELNEGTGHVRTPGSQQENFSDGDEVRRFDRIFDFLHDRLDDVQNITEGVAMPLIRLANLGTSQFIAGVVVGLLFVSAFMWMLVQILA